MCETRKGDHEEDLFLQSLLALLVSCSQQRTDMNDYIMNIIVRLVQECD